MGEWFFQTIFLPPTFSFLAHTRNCRFIWEGGKCPPCSSVLLPATWGKVGRWSPGCRRTEPTSTLVLLLLLLLLLLLFETFSFQLSAILTGSRTCLRWCQYPASLNGSLNILRHLFPSSVFLICWKIFLSFSATPPICSRMGLLSILRW